MSSISPHSSAALPLTGPDRAAAPPAPPGLSRVIWIKIGVIAALMFALFWVNLSRLWAKTNPFTGQGNWEHAAFIPLVGLYYLYVWRDQLLADAEPAARADAGRAGAAQADAGRWTLPGIWALLLAVPLLVLMAVAPVLAGGGGAGGVRAFLGSLADRGLSLLIPYVFGAVAVGGAAAAFVYWKRDELTFPATQAWLGNVWHGLGAWLTAMCVVWGVGFFATVLAPSSLDGAVVGLRYAAAAVGLAGLAHVAYWGKSLAWRRRYDAVLAGSSAWFGAFVMVWGILFSFWGIWPGQNDFFKDVGMVVALFGVVTLVAGWRVMAVAWFPIVFLFVAIPWPDQVYSWVALPLQNFAAKVGVFTLSVTGVDATQFGTKIVMAGANGEIRTLNVAEACAGLKSLMTFVFVSSAVAFLSTRLLWQKLVIVASAVPIAILCNAARVAGQGLLDFYVSRQWSENFAHGFAGLVMLIPGFFLILAVCWVLDHLFIEEADEPAVLRRGGPKPATAAAAAMASAPPTAPATIAPVARPVSAVPAAAAAVAAKKVITIPKKVSPPATTSASATPATAAPAATVSPQAPRPATAPRAVVAPAAPKPATSAPGAATSAAPRAAMPAAGKPPVPPATAAAKTPPGTAPTPTPEARP